MFKLKVGDKILVTAGKDKGRQGKVEEIHPKKGRVLIPGLNLYKKHVRGGGGREGGIIESSRPFPVANVAVVCPKCGKPTRVGFKKRADGEKVRICRKCGRELDTGKASRARKGRK